ncbi:hypothetical protein Zmor_004930 [Zophobas morio]|uniref:Tsg C-terminal domain-containing protein n=1 Tax=Zophobas morio TaxID=2755281 RepID=A0AA38IN10_9CUCU|nr:hypothetical protein Zmor_004930 [Zophobas morio]
MLREKEWPNITVEKIWKQVGGSKRGKRPGRNGLVNDVWTFRTDDLIERLCEIMNEMWKSKGLLESGDKDKYVQWRIKMWKLALLCAILGTLFLTPKVNTCNEAVCGSIECFNCLSYLYDECCSCVESGDQPGLLPLESHNIITVNCTVVFMKGCRTWHKCRSNCESMGSNSYRWFHDGCCECIGQHCINYGINESKCRECSMNQDEEEDDDDDEGDYGQDSDNALNL